MGRRSIILFVFLLLPLCALSQNARAGDAPQADPVGLMEGANLLGDMGGLRTLAAHYGISLGIEEESEVAGNLSGGLHRGVDFDGITVLTFELDTGKLLGLPGGTFYASGLQIYGRQLSVDNLAELQTVSNIQAERTTRLWDLWFDQEFWNGKADLKIGQQDVSEEFIVNPGGDLYLNSAMGWPALPAADLYAGGPVYPLSSVGIRLRVRPGGPVSFLGGVFDDNPPGGPFYDDSQLRGPEASGTRFNLTTGALWLGELDYRAKLFAGQSRGGLPGEYKLGGWYDTGKFPDQQFDTMGLSLANPASSGVARMHRGSFSVYAIAEQTVWRRLGAPRAASVFASFMGAPSDRNLVDWGLIAGVNLRGPLPGRTKDIFGVGYGWVHVSSRASGLDRQKAFFTGTAYPVRNCEQFIEITYRCRVSPWLSVQPDLQYIIDPGGGIADPLDPTRRVGDELVLGMRTIIRF